VNDLWRLDATAQAELVREKSVRPIELVEAAIKRIERLNPKLNAVVTPMYDRARAEASVAVPEGPFAGVPFLLKDLLAEYAEVRLTAGSAFVDGRYTPEADSELTRRLRRAGLIVVAAAGTADLPVAEEAALVAEALGNRVDRVYDCGVAGLHRLLDHYDLLAEANVIVAVAGMEGALPSVIGGLLDRPVIAVPTSIGYGASFGGIAALLAMLNSCAPGVSVVNIDNGYGAAHQASQINHLIAKIR